MAKPKQSRPKSKTPAASKPVIVAPSVDPGLGQLTVNIYDGTRRKVGPKMQVLLTITDGAQKQVHRDDYLGPTTVFSLSVHNNFADNYSVVAWADGYQQAGFQPVTVGPHAPQSIDLMLLPKNGTFHFAQANWSILQEKKQLLSSIFAASVTGDAADAYDQIMEDQPDHLACLLNITTAMQQVFLPNGTPLDFLKQLDLEKLAPDRIFGFADAKLVEQVRLAANQGQFQTQPTADLALHGDATSSFKQIQFGEANLQLTFHEKKTKKIGGIDCVYVEPDIDYYKDRGAHAIFEVIPNALSGNVSDPRVVYVLRWIAGQHAGLPNFDPLYTIE